MNIISLEINDFELNLIKKFLNNYSVDKIQNSLFVFKYKDTSIIVYESMKIVIQGKNAFEIYHELVENKIIDEQDLVLEDNSNNIFDQKSNDSIGCDEVGVGDFFGGLVAAACLVKKEDIEYLESIGVKDSKKLSDKKMKELFPIIIKKVRYSAKYLTPYNYNKKYDLYNNSHVIKTLLHNDALVELTKNFVKDENKPTIIMDEYCTEKNYQKYLQKINPSNVVNIDIFKIKAESSYIAVACASIIARIYFLNQIDMLNKNIEEYNVKIHLGNNEEVFQIAKTLYEKDKKILDGLVKKHFITYNKVIGEFNE